MAVFKSDITIHQLVSDKRSADILSVSTSGELLIGCRSLLANNQLHIYTELGHTSSIKLQDDELLKDAAWTHRGNIICITQSSVVTMSRSGDIICKTNIEHARSLNVSADNAIYIACGKHGVYQSTDDGLTWFHLFSSPDEFDFRQVIKVALLTNPNTDTFWTLEEHVFRIREYTLNKLTSASNKVAWQDISALAHCDEASCVMAYDSGLNIFVAPSQKCKSLFVLFSRSEKRANNRPIRISKA
jgi:hypothetical protein